MLARTDTLTGLGNRLALEELLEEETQKPGAEDNLVVIFLDVDGFKLVNDTQGHSVGDDLLVAMAGKFKDAPHRTGEGVFRLGGDEFVFVINTKDSGNSRRTPKEKDEHIDAFLNRMKQIVIGSGKELANPVEIDGSFGAASYHEGESIVQIIDRADEDMYKAKEKQKAIKVVQE